MSTRTSWRSSPGDERGCDRDHLVTEGRLVDPITLGVIWGALQSIAVEIGTTVHRTAYSEQAREGQDFSVAVFDPAGRMVAQGPYSPGHMAGWRSPARNPPPPHRAER